MAAGEEVLDVPATPAARVRLLGSGRSNKNDPNDARSVAITAMRSPGLAHVAQTDHATVLLLGDRYDNISRARNRTTLRLHSLLAQLVAGGVAGEITAASAEAMLGGLDEAERRATGRLRGAAAGAVAAMTCWLDGARLASAPPIELRFAVSGL